MRLGDLLDKQPELAEVDVPIDEEDIVVDLLLIARCNRLDEKGDVVLIAANEEMASTVSIGMLSYATLINNRDILSGPDETYDL